MSDEYARPRTSWPSTLERGPQQAGESMARALGQLLPFPSADLSAGLPLLGATSPGSPSLSDAGAAVASAAQIVSTAAGILDEEMARGVLTARDIGPQRLYGASTGAGAVDPTGGALKPLYDLVDNLARLWPAADRARSSGAASAMSPAAPAAFPELRPATALHPGATATLSMTLRNRETGPVTVVPAVTPLLGSNGERIPSQLLVCSPAQLTLEPGGAGALQITVTVPAICRAGCYTGVLVVAGVSDARAIVTIEVSDTTR